MSRRRGGGGPPEPQPEPPSEERPPRRTRPRSTRRRASPLRWLFALLLAFLLAPLALPYLLAYVIYPGQVLPGVRIQGLGVGGQTEAAISNTFAALHRDFIDQPINLEHEQSSWRPTLAELGAQFSPELLAGQAMAVGRSGDPLARLLTVYRLWRDGIEITPRLVLDQPTMQAYLLNIAREVDQPPSNAALSIAAAKVVGTPSRAGRQLLVDQSAEEITTALATLQPQALVLQTRTLAPAIGDGALVEAQNQALAMLESPLQLTRGEEQWVWPPDKLAELLRVDPQGNRLSVQVDPDQLARAVERLAQLVDTGTAEPRLRFVDGEVRIVEEGKEGWRLKPEQAVAAISATLQLSQPTTRTLSLPVERLKPQITAETLPNLGIKELVGEGSSSFAGSAEYRITNIKAGAARMDGVLIAPGEEFSFNTQLGEVDAANGFVEGYAIIGNRTQLEWGGGVCQDSTTVFRAAFWAGLPITERHAHTFYISWYDRYGLGPNGDGQGLDAAIFTGVQDLKFLNDTGNWLLMQATVDESAQVLTVRLYGTKPNREVRLEGPFIDNVVAAPSEPVYVDDATRASGTLYQSDVARSGRDIIVYRVLVENGVEIAREQFFTRFKAWPNIFVRGTG
jgi:vancomycin resistance protein YoaR